MINKTDVTERISYSELARRVGDCVMANSLSSTLSDNYDFELFNGKDSYCYTHESGEECEKNEYVDCDHESVEVYQEYVISQNSAEYLERNTNEIVYHCEALDLYLWGITHFGTSWDGVFTDIKL